VTGKRFEVRLQAQTPASPEQVWEAIATGPGISSWFVGRTDIVGDVVRTSFGEDWIPGATVTVRDEPHRFAYGSDTAPDGRHVGYEFLIEGRAGASTVLRAVTSGFLPGDDWEHEYEAMSHGTRLFFASLVEHLRFFAGRTGETSTTFGPPVDRWAGVLAGLGLPAVPEPGDTAADGALVYFADPHAVAVRSAHGLRRYIRGLHGAVVTDIVTYH
jgi:uncharacterized protein YndB with AHSA1/START domain